MFDGQDLRRAGAFRLGHDRREMLHQRPFEAGRVAGLGAAAWQCAPRDRWIGWSAQQRVRGLPLIANNQRFLILPWVRVDHLASHILGQVAGRISRDWQQRYGHPLCLLETFVQGDRFQGSCYRAANWVCVGQTTGRTRQNKRHRDHAVHAPVKDVYLYGLQANARQHLCG